MFQSIRKYSKCVCMFGVGFFSFHSSFFIHEVLYREKGVKSAVRVDWVQRLVCV